MMGSEDALPSTMNPDGAREDGGKSQLESMEMEIALLRSSEASLIAELQRRCDKAIELEVGGSTPLHSLGLAQSF